MDGGYGDYNRRALRHFGIERPLSGHFHFHSHITLHCTLSEAERAQALVGGKITVIELERAQRCQTDIMLTHYYVVNHRGLDDHLDVKASLLAKAYLLKSSGIEVTRVKLEHELLHQDSKPEEIPTSMEISEYIEAHIKCQVNPHDLPKLKELAAGEGWHPSRNPLQQLEGKAVQFVNRRFYNENSLKVVEQASDQMVALLADHCEIKEVKLETAVYDDNGDLDRWWMI